MWRQICVLGALAGALLCGQDSSNKATTVSGTVVNSATGEPISGALVIATIIPQFDPGRLLPQAAPKAQRAVTDASGRFSFDAVNPGTAQIQASRQGYQSENNADAVSVFLNRDKLNGAVIRMVPQSVVTGKVVNEDGEALSGITVELVKIEIQDGRRTLLDNFAAKVTDDRGEYRLWGVASGSYYVKVAGRSSNTNFLSVNTIFELSQEAYGPMYFPSAPSQEAAQIVRVAPGQTVTASFALVGAKAYQIRGQLVNAPPSRTFQARLLRGGDPLGNRAAVNLAANTFQVADVTPGTYTLQVYTADSGPMWFGEGPVTVEARDLTGVSLVLSPAVDVHARIESSEPLDFPPALSAERADSASPPQAYSHIDGIPESAGVYTFERLLPGNYRIAADVFRGEDYVASITAGSTDVLANGLTVTPGGTPDLVIAMRPDGGTIIATVEGASSSPSPAAGLGETLLWVRPTGGSATYRTQLASGETRLTGLAPGDYTLYAFPTDHPFEYRNPAVLSALSQYATTVHVEEGDMKEVMLKPIPEAALP